MLYEKAARLGDSNAMLKFGIILCEGILTTKDFERGFEYIRESAGKGNENAQLNLPNNKIFSLQSGIDLLTTLAEKGNRNACIRLGNLYYEGNFCLTIKADHKKAIYYFELNFDRNHDKNHDSNDAEIYHKIAQCYWYIGNYDEDSIEKM